MTLWVSSGERPLCQSVPRKRSMYSVVFVGAFIHCLLFDCYWFCPFNNDDERGWPIRTSILWLTRFSHLAHLGTWARALINLLETFPRVAGFEARSRPGSPVGFEVLEDTNS